MKSTTSTCHRGFVPPVASTRGLTMGANWSDILAPAKEMIGQYYLNADQSESLKQCAEMFNPETSRPPIVLIHGVLWDGVKWECDGGEGVRIGVHTQIVRVWVTEHLRKDQFSIEISLKSP